jgi:voltage-gated potassium channel Kch
VIFDIAAGSRVLDEELSQLLILVVTLSLVATPAVMSIAERIARPRGKTRVMETVKIEEENQVIIAGFDRYGQVVGRILRAKKIPFTALEDDPDQIDFVAKFGARVYYGDAARPEVLRAAHADKASIFVLAVEDVDQSLRIAETVINHFPNLTVLARARDRQHAYRLMDLGVTLINRELLLSSIDTARQVMEALGVSAYEATRITDTFRKSDQRQLQEMHASWTDEERQIAATLAWTKELEQIFEQDVAAEKTG